ncbi:MAG: efflux RND transporter periplasmic adaptor subunit [Gammaproteobacteria bacterium]
MIRFHLILALLATQLLAGCDTAIEAPVPEDVQAHAVAHTQPGYVCPMHPQITSEEPGTCPICGMDLVQRQLESALDDSVVVRISAEVRNNLGVRTETVGFEPLPRVIDAVGQVTYDESQVRHVHARAEGWVQRVYVSSVGDRIAKGKPLVELFSPVLESAQQEYLQALRMGGDALVSASESRLRSLGIGEDEIARLRKERKVDGFIVFRSEMDGVVTQLSVRDGMFVRPATDMVVLADLDRVWIEADVLTRQAGWLAPGLPATVSLDQSEGPALRGELSYVYPEADPVTRAVRVRLSFANPGGRLMPNSFATVRIKETGSAPVLQVPREALIRTSRETRVILDLGDNRFQPRGVTVAYESGRMAAITDGLSAGDRVVVSGQFMLDSEASLRSELQRVTSGSEPASAPSAHQH